MARRRLTTAQARRIAIAAQGLDRPGPGSRATLRHIDALMGRLGVVQIDSVAVVARAHLLTLFARLGPFPLELLRRATSAPPRRMIEAWGHEACFVTPEAYNLLGFRAERRGERYEAWARSVGAHRPEFIAEVTELVDRTGPLTAREAAAALEDPGPRDRSHWGWNRSDTKHALEYLFAIQRLGVAGRNAQFERTYDLVERVLPPSAPPLRVEREEAIEILVESSLAALGVGTVGCVADYYRLSTADTAHALRALVARGVAEPVEVEAWPGKPAFLHATARRPRQVDTAALLAPFDSLIFERDRVAALFGMHYRIGIYTPAARRTHGYYALPLLVGDHLVARVDLKADRQAGELVVRGLYWEPGYDKRQYEGHLAEQLERLRSWLFM